MSAVCVLVSGQLLKEFRAFRDTEWREFRVSVSAWQQETGERITRLETQVKAGVTGNGQPSRLAVVEQRVRSLEWVRWYVGGAVIAIWTTLTAVLRCLPWGHK
jgi:hypothetical protein